MPCACPLPMFGLDVPEGVGQTPHCLHLDDSLVIYKMYCFASVCLAGSVRWQKNVIIPDVGECIQNAGMVTQGVGHTQRANTRHRENHVSRKPGSPPGGGERTGAGSVKFGGEIYSLI